MDMPLPLQLYDEVEQEFVELGGDSDNASVQMIGKDGGNSKSKGSSTTQTSRKRKRKLTSNVRQYFDLLPIGEDGKERCKCKKCGQTYLLACKYGIGNLKKHIEKCPRIDSKDIEEYSIEQSTGWSISTRSKSFNQEKFRELLVNAMIKHDLPLSFVEYEGVRAIFSYLEPNVSHISRNMCKLDVKKVHTEYIAEIIDQLKQCPGRICLTFDYWSSIATDGYISLTAHYIDKNWVLQKRVLNFSCMPPSHSGVALAEKIYNLVASWGIEKKLFSITLDGASANNSCVELLKSQLNLQKCLVDSGSLFHVNCCAYILNLIVREGLKEIGESIEKVRECVKYVKGSPSRKQKFLECVVHTLLDSKRSLKQDVPTRWKSTYLMLSNALYYKLAFCHLQFNDSNFNHNPSGEEWEEVEKMCSFLKLFYDATDEFSSVKNPTSNLYFLDVFLIQLKLIEEMKSSDAYMKKIATSMYSKFDKYWKEYSPLLAIAVVFDPRYKMQFVEFSFRKLYGSDGSLECSKLKSKLFSLFEAYKCNLSTGHGKSSSDTKFQGHLESVCASTKKSRNLSRLLQEFDDYESEHIMKHMKKTELELYLDEPRVDRTSKLDVLSYWKADQYKYPLLAQMVRDVLTIPFSTIASEFVFSNSSKVLDSFKSSLSSDLVESLICAQDWLYGEALSDKLNLDEVVQDIMTLGIKEGRPNESSNASNVEVNV